MPVVTIAAPSAPDLARAAENRFTSSMLLLLFSIAVLPGVVLVAQFVMFVILVLFRLIATIPRNLELIVAAVGVACAYPVILHLLYHRSARILLWIAGARPAGPREEGVARWIAEWSSRAGMPQPALYIIERTAPNCFSAGLDPAHAVIAMTTGLLELLTPAEREAAVAHELSHIASLDTRVNTLAAIAIAVLRLPWDLFAILRARLQRYAEKSTMTSVGSSTLRYFRWTFLSLTVLTWYLPLWFLVYWFGDRRALFFILSPRLLLNGLTSVNESAVWWMLIPLWALVLAPMLAPLWRTASSASTDVLADARAVSLIGGPDAMIHLLAKIKGSNPENMKVHRSLGHLLLVDPAVPALDRRIARLTRSGATVSARTIEQLEWMGSDLAAGEMSHSGPAVRVNSSVGTSYELLAPAALLMEPNPASRPEEQLPAGAQVTVFTKAGEFFQAVAQSGRFGYLPAQTPMRRQ